MNDPLRRLAVVVALLFASLLVSTTVIQYADAGALDAHGDNTRTLIKQRARERGPILVAGQPVAQSVPVDDRYKYQRRYPVSPQEYAPVTGAYTIQFGATGIEDAASDLLAGTADQLFYRRLSDLLTGREPAGASVELTIDPAAQKAAWDALGDQQGAVVALDPTTGAILALVSKPSYDPNVLAAHDLTTAAAARKRLLADDGRPLDNRAIASRGYPPGSVFKLVTAAAALSSGRYSPTSNVPGPASLTLPQTNRPLGNDFSGACGANNLITLQRALQISCNTAFASVGLALGDQAMADQAQKFGFGDRVDIPMGVTPSFFPADPSPPQLAQASIGQFDVRVTPMQVAMVAAGIANKGVVMRPYLVNRVRAGSDLSVISRAAPTQLSRAVSADVASQLTSMMETVVDAGTGTRAQISGVRVAGKTGTAQTAPGQPPTAWFTAFAPADAPKVAVAVVVENGGSLGDAASGGRVAAPIAKAVMRAVLR